ncbi:methyltransferase [Streptomyces cremeus]|uniref:3-amino-4-hydroxybenzoate 4-O-methyltransferase n=2 Tax=Streptomyces cremeus TaxID=66881 RepID=CREN_STRCM|nr:RecName: Full=3-amino-4-hydroxybenzoate 4-O-methyltransferase [Streptomyces cremeus]ALA99211.1 CreN [Streptomyces cremeus]BAU09311.1 O-methyltransferase [Streptomyces cremeus]
MTVPENAQHTAPDQTQHTAPDRTRQAQQAAPDTAGRRLIELMAGFWKTQAIYLAAESGLVDAIAAAGRAPAVELANRTGTDPDALGRLLLFLESLDVVSGEDPAGYALTPVGELLRTGTQDSMRDHVRIYGSHFYRAWGALDHSLRTGRSAFTEVYGSDLFRYLNQHPDLSLTYERAMVAGTPFFAQVPEVHDFSGARLIVDVAGGHGALLHEILKSCPEPRAVLFDAPHVIAETADRPIASEHGDRVTLVPGDFFEGVPQGGDVYLLSRILHCFDDEACLRILAHCRSAMAPGGRLVVVERLLTRGTGSSLAQGYNMHMLVVLGGGRERDEDAYRTLLEKAGFQLDSVTTLPLETHLMAATLRR